ncbi:ribosomal maturation YjgA family protein [Flavobacterium humi]|uniref:DUF2809 domain-containing protein n=1 Tax=Flavobacterium humi TaxID=2562683 RepID=A0A4Z0LBP0_9FLAO|nr:DUF2809 domain-containing protein [Flavobacterium humi]TGD59272.1 DUF2809 domain-containing protein [Flavobacterium humi]
MKQKRLAYFLIVLLLIAAGLLSRKTAFIPLFFGDMLYAMMIFFVFRMCFLQFSGFKIAFISLLFCYLIEISQLYQDIWIDTIRKTFLGHCILGQGFLWSDLIVYAFGILCAFWVDKKR